jgi:tellurite resistance protein
MKHFRIAIILLMLISSVDSFCQSNEKVEMADIVRQDGKIYTVVFGLVIILTAMIILLIRVDRKIFRLEGQIKKEE